MIENNVRTKAQARYTGIAIGLHWGVALLILNAFYLGWTMTSIPGFTPRKLEYYSWHKWIGVTVFSLTVIRLIWRVNYRAPSLPHSMSGIEKAAAHATHGLLYLLMILVPLSGYFFSSAAGFRVIFLGIVPMPTFISPNPALKSWLLTIHTWLNYSLLSLVGLHVLAAIKHQFVNRDSILSRMVPFIK